MANTYFVGMRGTDDFVTNENPENWRQGILTLFPNGSAPLTALTALMPSKKLTNGPHFHWWTSTMPSQRLAITGVYSDAALSSAYTSGAVAGRVLFLKTSDTTGIQQFRAGHVVLLRDASDYRVDVRGYVTAVVVNGTSSYISVQLLEADDNSTDHDLSDCDVMLIIGTANAQGANRPEAIVTKPSELDNYTQIFRNAVDMSRTAMLTNLRTGDPHTLAKNDALWQHSVELEKGYLWGKRYATTGTNGKPLTFTQGLIPNIIEYASANVDDFTLNPSYAGHPWVDSGEEWLDSFFELCFRYGESDERLAFMGSGALLGIQKLVKAGSQYNITKMEGAYGIKVLEWITPFGTIYFKTHPLFSFEATNRNSMLVFEPKNLEYNYITDTTFMPDAQFGKGGGQGKDGVDEEYLTESGLEHHFPETCLYLNGVGQDNALS